MLQKYAVIEKRVGETPLQAIARHREAHPEYAAAPMAYAGRLDPMASGKLLVLIGDECKRQEAYHALDKEYEFEVLLGSQSDTGDILGLVDWREATNIEAGEIRAAARSLIGPLSLPYPHFSSRPVKGMLPHLSSGSQRRAEHDPRIGAGGRPLFMWALEGRLDQIEIPTADTTIYSLKLLDSRMVPVEAVYEDAMRRIGSMPPVTDASKALGRNFRRSEVRVAWQVWLEHHRDQEVQIVSFVCRASSGTYMRSLASKIARHLGTTGLAYSIHRSVIGAYRPLPFGLGFWTKRF